MSDYLTNLAARSLDPTPAIQPRLASLFEPLREVGPMFPRPVGDRLEGTAVSEEAVPDLVQARAANGPVNEPRTAPSPITASKVFDESSHPGAIREVTPRVPKRGRRPVATTMKPAAEQSPRLEMIVDGISASGQTVSAEPPKAGTQDVVPVGRLSAGKESPHRNDPSPGETTTPPARNESAPTLPDEIREPHRLASARRLQNKSGERRTSEQLIEPQVANNPTRVAPADHTDQRAQSRSLVVPRIVIERTNADRDQRPPISVPVSFVPNGGKAPRSSTNDLDTTTGFRARPPAELEKEASQTEAVEPVINVTIGRVEVRAVAPANAQPKDRHPTSSSKLMSLDDYLRQRAQGGKR